jgi:predicted GNAT family acetyltransferase
MTMDEIVDNAEMHRFEMPVGDDLAVAYYKEQDGRLVLLHTEVPQQLSGQGVGSRLAHAVFETLKARGRRVIAKCPFMASYATKHTDYLAMLDG